MTSYINAVIHKLRHRYLTQNWLPPPPPPNSFTLKWLFWWTLIFYMAAPSQCCHLKGSLALPIVQVALGQPDNQCGGVLFHFFRRQVVVQRVFWFERYQCKVEWNWYPKLWPGVGFKSTKPRRLNAKRRHFQFSIS